MVRFNNVYTLVDKDGNKQQIVYDPNKKQSLDYAGYPKYGFRFGRKPRPQSINDIVERVLDVAQKDYHIEIESILVIMWNIYKEIPVIMPGKYGRKAKLFNINYYSWVNNKPWYDELKTVAKTIVETFQNSFNEYYKNMRQKQLPFKKFGKYLTHNEIKIFKEIHTCHVSLVVKWFKCFLQSVNGLSSIENQSRNISLFINSLSVIPIQTQKTIPLVLYSNDAYTRRVNNKKIYAKWVELYRKHKEKYLVDEFFWTIFDKEIDDELKSCNAYGFLLQIDENGWSNISTKHYYTVREVCDMLRRNYYYNHEDPTRPHIRGISFNGPQYTHDYRI